MSGTKLRTLRYRHEAELLRGVLAAHGIEAWVVSDDCGALDLALEWARGAHLVVAEEDAGRAEEVLAQAPTEEERE